MIANIWGMFELIRPEPKNFGLQNMTKTGEKEHIEETISTLRFATRMMCVTNTPLVNVQFDPMALIKKYEREIKELKQELSMHDSLSNRSHVHYEAFGDSQRYELQKHVKAFLEEDEAEVEVKILWDGNPGMKRLSKLYPSV
jgi:kinesin family protein 6/9